jgi:hypothetical protein
LLIHQDLPALAGPAVALCTNFARILSVPELSVGKFEAWLNCGGRTPREQAMKVTLRQILGLG